MRDIVPHRGLSLKRNLARKVIERRRKKRMTCKETMKRMPFRSSSFEYSQAYFRRTAKMHGIQNLANTQCVKLY
jgi:hypothetical protein